MACEVAAFDAMPWSPGGHPLEKKRGPAGSVVMLEFAPGFADPAWCHRSHVIYVVSGELTLELEDRVQRVTTGQAVTLDAGTPHRAANAGSVDAVLFVVSDV